MLLSVVIPTFNEAENVSELLDRLDASLNSLDCEIIIVDDGTDDLPERVAAHAVNIPVKVIRRSVPSGRLGGAVVQGMKMSAGQLILVCDGDLQHPPELIPTLVNASSTSDLVVASRYAAGGSAGGLSSWARRRVSRVSGFASRILFPHRLRKCSDPMSGFFLVHRRCLDLDNLRPRGFKILLEIIARSQAMNVSEIPFEFGARTAGVSHASLVEGWRFAQQLLTLRLWNKAALFMFVGASGTLINLSSVWLLTEAGTHFVLANIAAIQIAVLWNFLGAEFVVWRDARAGRWLSRFWRFVMVAETDLIRVPFVVLLVWILGGHSVTASLITLVAAFFARFTLADKIVYGRRTGPVAPPSEAVVDLIVDGTASGATTAA